jgi:hypothetical protein
MLVPGDRRNSKATVDFKRTTTTRYRLAVLRCPSVLLCIPICDGEGFSSEQGGVEANGWRGWGGKSLDTRKESYAITNGWSTLQALPLVASSRCGSYYLASA